MTGCSDEILSTNIGTKVVQVTNIAPQATRDQMSALFGFIGKIEDIRLYPTMRDVSLAVQSRICYVKYFDPSCTNVAQHLTNTVFIDRALIITPYTVGEIPDEYRALDIASQASVIPGLYPSDPKLPPHIVNQIEGIPPNQVITTHDPILASSGLPLYPPLPITYDSRRIEEIRRTLVVINVDESITGEQIVEFFQKAGDVKYVRFCTRDNDASRYALVEFSEQNSIMSGLKLNGTEMAGKRIQVYHSTQAIGKPMAKSNEAAQREIEEAMTRVKEAQSMISAAIDPVIGILSKDKKRSRSRSRSRRRSRSRSGHRRRSHSRSRHRSKHSRRRSVSRSRRSHSRSSRSKRRSRSRGRHRSRSRDNRRRSSHSRSRRSHDRSKRSRSRGHTHSRHRHKSKDNNRSKSHSRRRSRSRSSKSKNRRSGRDDSRSRKEKDHHSDRKKSRKSNSKERSILTDKSKQSSSKHKSKSPLKRKSRTPKRKSKSPKRKSRSISKIKSIPSKRDSRSISKRISRSPSRIKSRSISKRKSMSMSQSPLRSRSHSILPGRSITPRGRSRSIVRDRSVIRSRTPIRNRSPSRSRKVHSSSWRGSRSRS